MQDLKRLVSDYLEGPPYKESCRKLALCDEPCCGIENFELEFERRFGPNSPILQKIKSAASCRDFQNKKMPHQRRIPNSVINSASKRLMDQSARLVRQSNFCGLHKLVSKLISGIKGIGDLMIYDIALRLGCLSKIRPEKVYLHRGAKKGARHLGLKGATIEMSDLPQPLRRLSPMQVEDFLCVYEDALGKYTKKRLPT